MAGRKISFPVPMPARTKKEVAALRQPLKSFQLTFIKISSLAKRAIVSITIDEEFVIHDIKVIEGDKGLFIAMPSKKATDGEYRDIAHPFSPP